MLGANYLGQTYLGDLEAARNPVVLEQALQIVETELAGFGNGWTDITPDLTDDPMIYDRSFQSDRPDDLVSAPPSATFGVRNDIGNQQGVRGLYSPDSGVCRAGWGLANRVRIRFRNGTTLRDRFFGSIQSIAPTLGIYEDQRVAVTAAGWLALAATTPAEGVTAQFTQRGDQLLATLMGLSQFPPPATQFGVGSDVYPLALDDLDPAQNSLYDGIDSTTKSGLDRVFERANGTLVFEPRSVRINTPDNLFVVTDTAPAGFPGAALSGGSLQRELAAIYNKAELTGHPRDVTATPIVLYTYPISSSSPYIEAGDTVTIRVPYADPTQLAQSIAAFNTLISDGASGAIVGTVGMLPSTDFEFTSAPNGGGSDVSSQVPVAVVYEARQATLTLGPNGSGARAYYFLLQCRGQAIRDYTNVVGTAKNATSIGMFGAQRLSVDCRYQTNATFLQAVAQYIVAVYGVGISRFDQGLQMDVSSTDLASLEQLLSFDISDPIAVSESMSGISSGPYWINGVREEWDERCNLKLTWRLARRLFQNTWQIETPGRSEIDQTTVVQFF